VKCYTYNHNCNTAEVPDRVLVPVLRYLEGLDFHIRRNCAGKLKAEVTDQLRKLGWSYRVHVARNLRVSITGVNNKVGVGLQLGNMAMFYADLLKLQVAYENKLIESAIYVLPTKNAAKRMGSNIANFERLISELPHYARVITLPIYIIGVEEDDNAR
jgi:hypothetical protein